MSTSILTLEKANMFCGLSAPDSLNSLHLELTEVKLPAMNEQYVDHRAGGVPIAVEVDTIFAKLECTFQLLGWDTQVASLIASWGTDQNTFHVFGLLRDRRSGLASQAYARMKGRLGLSDPQLFRRGDAMHWNYGIKGIIMYKLQVGGNPLYTWDFFDNTFIVGGVDRNSDDTRIMQIPVPGSAAGATAAAGGTGTIVTGTA